VRRRRQPYRPDEDAAIRAEGGPRLSLSVDAARRLCAELPGRNTDSILLRARYLRMRDGMMKPRAGEGDAPVLRRCLGCGGRFEAPGRFIRVCAPCKNSDAWRCGA
jgi:hypothetical protein